MNSILNGMANAEITYESIQGIPSEDTLVGILELYNHLFDDADDDFFRMRLNTHPEALIVTARHRKQIIGFKIGYPVLNEAFYSWIGGVHPDFRRKGIASRLADEQEKWVRRKGFKRLKTKSMNRFKPMIMLNLQRGFNITKVYTNEKGQTKIVFFKDLD